MSIIYSLIVMHLNIVVASVLIGLIMLSTCHVQLSFSDLVRSFHAAVNLGENRRSGNRLMWRQLLWDVPEVGRATA